VSLIIAAGIVIAAAVLTFAGIAGVIDRLRQLALAKPNQRSSHTVPTPQGGGAVLVPVALLIGGIALVLAGEAPRGGPAYAALVGAAAAGLAVVGFLDDMRGLGVLLRLAAQGLAVACAVGLMPAELRALPALVPLPLERLLEAGALLWFVNLTNFMDGIDLISAVETVAIALGIVILASIGTIPASYGYLALALAGATLGFAPWNAPTARLFLGDAGSLAIGLLLGILLIHIAALGHAAAALILPLYYLADATITLLRRLLRGARVWEAHREHYYQQATRNGFSVPAIVARIAALDAALIGLALLSALAGPWWAAAALAAAAAAVGLTLLMFVRPRR
jgi:UDP-N-acetylmuramyl pentapeptide phosphotransferase/UDP-N-acetylglucosamine-1-phosphate transferase